jgi:hypothetical protein
MIGLKRDNNDVFLYFENGDILAVGEGRCGGNIYDDNSKKIGSIEVFVSEGGMEYVEVDFEKGDDGICGAEVRINPRYFERFQNLGSCEDHQGYRHVHLLDVFRLDGLDKVGYDLFKDQIRE